MRPDYLKQKKKGLKAAARHLIFSAEEMFQVLPELAAEPQIAPLRHRRAADFWQLWRAAPDGIIDRTRNRSVKVVAVTWPSQSGGKVSRIIEKRRNPGRQQAKGWKVSCFPNFPFNEKRRRERDSALGPSAVNDRSDFDRLAFPT